MTPCCRSAVHSTPLQTCNHVMFHCSRCYTGFQLEWLLVLIPLPLNSSTGNSCQVPPALCAGLQFTAPRSHPACTQIAPHSMFCPVTGTEFHHDPSHVSSDGVRSVPWGLQPTLHRQATAEQKHLMPAHGPDQTRSDQSHVLSANMLAQRRISS